MDRRTLSEFHVVSAINTSPGRDLVSTAIHAGTLRTFVGALKQADLVNTLEGRGPFTVFAPTDDAFARLRNSPMGSMITNRDRLAEVITHHVVPGRLLASEFTDQGAMAATTFSGDTLRIESQDGKVMVNGVEVVEADIQGSNGVIHVINGVLVPEG